MLPAYQTIVQKLSQNEPSLSSIMDAISFLSKCLEDHFQKKVILLIDEFDTPITEAHIRHFYEELPKSLVLTDLSSFQYVLLTGIQPFTNEVCSSFSYPNIDTVADQEYAQYFGFTQEETQRFLQYYGLNLTDEVKDMYEGYRIGDYVLYNPWSIINYADTKELNAYWINTNTNTMITDAMDHCDSTFKKDYESLILDDFVETTVFMKNSFFKQASSSSLWGLFVNAGYLTIQKKTNHSQYQLRIPKQ